MRDLVPFVQFKKRENTHGAKSNTPSRLFFMFFYLYKCYQIAQRITFINSMIHKYLNVTEFWYGNFYEGMKHWCTSLNKHCMIIKQSQINEEVCNFFLLMIKSLNLSVQTIIFDFICVLPFVASYDKYDCMILSCHVRVPEWIHTLL